MNSVAKWCLRVGKGALCPYMSFAMKKLLSILFGLWLAAPVAAHPHVFIDTGLTLHLDAQGKLTRIEVTWVYDDFYSLLITEDMGLDPDFDGVLTAAETEALTGFDMRWIEGFNGDLEVYQGAELLPLSGPRDYTASFADGRITTTHVRDVGGDQTGTAAFQVMPYDLTYYTAYDVTLPVVLKGRDDCKSQIELPDLTAGLMAAREQLNALDPDMTPEEAGLPNIGKKLAATVIVTCPAS